VAAAAAVVVVVVVVVTIMWLELTTAKLCEKSCIKMQYSALWKGMKLFHLN
jgi:VIT1/CCC1 family predicted Fe2+/Mn2+ transporter